MDLAQAELDIAQLAMFIGRQSLDSADRLFTEFYNIADRLAEFPELGQAFPTMIQDSGDSELYASRIFQTIWFSIWCKAKVFRSFECFMAQEIWTRSLDDSLVAEGVWLD